MTDQRSAPKRPIGLFQPTDSTSSSSSSKPTPLPRPSRLPDPEPARILGIDIENHPLWYGGGDYVYDLVFCISDKWVGSRDDDVETVFIDWRNKDSTILRQLAPLRARLTEADAFLGHNFRHDWKGLRALFAFLDQPDLERKPLIDTMRAVPSGPPRSLEHFCSHFGLGEKPHLTPDDWIKAIFRWIPEKRALVEHRNRMDVILTERLYAKEKELGWL